MKHVHNEVWDQVEGRVYNQVVIPVPWEAQYQIWDQVYDQVYKQVADQVYDSVGHQVWIQVLQDANNPG